MTKTLAELRLSPAVKPQERVYSVCVAGQLVRRLNEILDAADDLAAERASIVPPVDPEKPQPPQRLGRPQSARVKELDAQLADLEAERLALKPQILDHTGNLTLRAGPSGAWRRFVDQNPARTIEVDDQTRIDPRDVRIAQGACNGDALLAVLGDYVVAWEDEPLAREDWATLYEPNIAPGDLNLMARLVVDMHEKAHDLPKLLNGSLLTPQSGTG